MVSIRGYLVAERRTGRRAAVVLNGLADQRVQKLLTQLQLAQAAKVAVSTVARAEGGGATTPLIAQKLASALGVTVDDLRQRKPETARASA